MKRILLIALLAGLAYGGWLFTKPYFTKHFLERQMQGLADKADLKSDREIIKELVAFAGERDLPLTPRSFKITRYDGRTRISVSYRQVVEIPYYSREYRFNVEVVS